ncbi:hypothetical protein BLGI_926 [Brevibacillus laterosporus GI-9]|nr:hypothetical protein BLGI_926 [Brevibacillus laterosporus GI-9]
MFQQIRHAQEGKYAQEGKLAIKAGYGSVYGLLPRILLV